MDQTAVPRDAEGGLDEAGARHVAASEAKATFSALIEGVQHRGERYVIERHGKPAAALVSVDELGRLAGRDEAAAGVNDGLSGFIGLFADIMTDDEIDNMVAAIYADRERDVPRAVDISGWIE